MPLPVKTLIQMIRYGLVGLLATAVHYALMAWLVGAGWYPVSASTAGAIAGAFTAYFANRSWTFPVRHSRQRLTRFMAVASLGLLMNAVLLSILHHRVLSSLIAAQLATTALVFLATFFLNRHWSFSGPDE